MLNEFNIFQATNYDRCENPKIINYCRNNELNVNNQSCKVFE